MWWRGADGGQAVMAGSGRGCFATRLHGSVMVKRNKHRALGVSGVWGDRFLSDACLVGVALNHGFSVGNESVVFIWKKTKIYIAKNLKYVKSIAELSFKSFARGAIGKNIDI